MAGTVNIPLTTLTVGSHVYGPAAVADTDSKVTLTIDRTVASGFNATPAAAASIECWQSGDGGSTWQNLAKAGIAGGTQLDKNGQPFAVSSVTVGFSPGTGRQARAVIVVSGASVAVQGSLATS